MHPSAKLLLPLLLWQAASATPLPITSTFDNGQEDGWIAMNLTGDSLDLLTIEDGSPGEDTPAAPAPGAGLLSFFDIDAGDWGFVSTNKFAGDLSAAFGGTLSFTQRWGTLLPEPDPTENFTPNVVIGGVDAGGNKIAIASFNPVILSRNDQHPFSKPLNTSGGWVWVDDLTPFGPPNDLTPATDAQILQVLSHVRFLFILGEFLTGDDRGYLDNVTLSAPAPLALAATRRTDGTVLLRVTGAANRAKVVIQASDNLADWKEIHSVVPTGDAFEFVDLDAPVHPNRFYRSGPGT